MDRDDASGTSRGSKSRDAFRTISEVADTLDLPQHVLRFWESKFSQIKPLKRGGNRRYYRPDDVLLLTTIKHLLHTEGYTIRGVQKLFKAQGVKATIDHVMDAEGADTIKAEVVSSLDTATPQPPRDTNSIQAAPSDEARAHLTAALSRLKRLRDQLA